MKDRETKISIAFLREVLRYDADSGNLYWLRRKGCRPEWNTRYSGKRAFTTLTPWGYNSGSINNTHFQAHRVVWALVHGNWPGDMDVDHLDGNRKNNRIENLRLVSKLENSRNKGMTSRNSSGVVGVCWHKGAQKWLAQYSKGNWPIYLGVFSDKEEAAQAVRAAREAEGFHPNHGTRAAFVDRTKRK